MYQRLYIACPDVRADSVESAVTSVLGVTFLRMARGVFTRGGTSCSGASFQATDAQAAQIVSALDGLSGVFLLRGPDDDGPRAGDVLVDAGDPVPGDASKARYSWRRVAADLNLVLVFKGPP